MHGHRRTHARMNVHTLMMMGREVTLPQTGCQAYRCSPIYFIRPRCKTHWASASYLHYALIVTCSRHSHPDSQVLHVITGSQALPVVTGSQSLPVVAGSQSLRICTGSQAPHIVTGSKSLPVVTSSLWALPVLTGDWLPVTPCRHSQPGPPCRHCRGGRLAARRSAARHFNHGRIVRCKFSPRRP